MSFVPEGSGNPGAAIPKRILTKVAAAKLYDGHISAECSIRHNGAPACPECLKLRLSR